MSKDDPTLSIPASPKGESGSGLDSTLPGRTATTMEAAARALPKGETDRYDLSGEFAHGAIGRILHARDRRLNRPVAIKELIFPGGTVEARFVTEALITARLQHPSIVPVYDAGRWDTGEPFYAMKFVSGRSLADVIGETKTLQERLALLPHVLAVAEAIAYAHTERVIHRDLKPANVLVGDFGETVVIDWGLAKDLAHDAGAETGVAPTSTGVDASLTHMGTVVGTPAYMPPEQAAGRIVDERADVYALGAILYHLLAGSRPYDSGSSAQVIDQVVRGPPTSLSARQKGIPSDLLTIVAKAMARNPSERYATARELAEDLRRFQTGQIVAAHAYSLGERIRRFIRRYRAVVAVTVVAMLALIGVGTVSFFRILAERDRAERKQAEAEAARRDAETARQQELERADELTLMHARTSVDRDPNEVIPWLRSLSQGFSRWSAVRTIAADAQARGFAIILRGHTQTVDDVGFTRDGRYLVTTSDDTTIRLWDMKGGGARILTGHTDEVWRLSVSPDGRLLATASKDRTARIWNLETGESQVLAGHTGPVDTVLFTPDGRQLIVSNRGDGLLRIWNVASGGLDRTLDTGLGPLSLLSRSPDGRYVLVHALSGPRAQLWDLQQGTAHTLEHEGTVTAIAFSPRGDLAITGALDQTLRAWDPRTGKGRILGQRLGSISYLAFSPDGGKLAVGTSEGQLRLFNLDTNKNDLLGSHEGRINEILFSRDGRLVASSSDDRTARLWELANGHSRILRGHQGAAYSMDFSPDGQWLAVGSYDKTTRLFNVKAEPNRLLAKTSVALNTLVASPSGRLLASLGGDGSLRLFDVTTKAILLREQLSNGEPAPIQFSPDSRWLAAGGKDGRLRLWDIATGQPVRHLEGHTQPITALTFHRDSQSLATADDSGELRLWEPNSGQTRSLGRHDHEVRRLAFSPDGQRLASGSKKGELRLWDLITGSFRELHGHDDVVTSLLFSPDGQRLVSGSLDHTLRIWDLATGTSQKAGASGNGVQNIAMSPDGLLLVSASVKDGILRLWDARTGESRGVLQGHQGDITDVALSPDSRRVASSSIDNTVRLWDLATNESRVLRGHAARATGVVFLDNKHLASSGWDGTLRSWADDLPTDPAALREWMKTVGNIP
ncbi:WD40 repeat domain-containing serine/threonine protein kinase [Hyalangium sp.]|uniref:WD40 repeat domain-containing serine/threonine protein kinase n=1 Tax=Hyalangium sp. TaxID=2028555 RepID=UPI002D44F187|nr:protein kinase [Hyalangium sp.]HYH96642.1 protein kinase [Hyalangium sp.]